MGVFIGSVILIIIGAFLLFVLLSPLYKKIGKVIYSYLKPFLKK